MVAAVCVKYSEIVKVQFKLSLRMNLLLAVAVAFLASIICGVENLDATASSMVLERFISFTGIVLLTPIFLPEQDKSIAELAESKYTSHIKIYLIRFILSVVSLLVLISGFVTVMLVMSCEFDVLKYIFGTFATAFFLGAAGFAAYALSDNVIAGYLLPLGYYMFNMFNGAKLKNLYLFSLAQGTLTEKYWLLAVGAGLVVLGLVYKYIRVKIR